MKKLIYIAIAVGVLFTACRKDKDIDFKPGFKGEVSTYTDPRDGQTYRCVKIGNQIWLAENLKFRPTLGGIEGAVTYDEPKLDSITVVANKQAFNDSLKNAANKGEISFQSYMAIEMYFLNKRSEYYKSSLSDFLSGQPRGQKESFAELFAEEVPLLWRINSDIIRPTLKAKADANTDFNYVKQYGYLYSYDAARKAVPQGWRLPTDDDWKTLERTLGMNDSQLDLMNDWRGVNQGELLIYDQNIQFDALLAGGQAFGPKNGHISSNYIYKGIKGYFWTADKAELVDSIPTALIRAVELKNKKIYRGTSPRVNGVYYSVRCVKETAD